MCLSDKTLSSGDHIIKIPYDINNVNVDISYFNVLWLAGEVGNIKNVNNGCTTISEKMIKINFSAAQLSNITMVRIFSKGGFMLYHL